MDVQMIALVIAGAGALGVVVWMLAKLVDDGVPVNMVQRVMGHERSSTTLDLYTRRTDDHDRILQALDDDDVC